MSVHVHTSIILNVVLCGDVNGYCDTLYGTNKHGIALNNVTFIKEKCVIRKWRCAQ